jgi:Leucine-rich repeat (LRR) protein
LKALLGLPSKVDGVLPTELGLLSNLHVLYLINMHYLREGVPSQFIHLSQLSSLHILSSLHDEILFSSILSSLPSTLESLFLEESNIIEQIPNELTSFHHLTSLVVLQSRLTGTLPSKLGLMTKLQSLAFRVTLLSGKIPSEIGNLTQLTEIDLSCNKFSNVVPTELNKFSNLKSVNFNQVCNR